MERQIRHYLRKPIAYVQISIICLVIYIILNNKKIIIFSGKNIEHSTPKIHLADLKLNNISRCYAKSNMSSIRYFADIMDHEHQPINGKSIFFLETSCSKTGVVQLNSRQACSIESAALHNPNRDIFVLFASPVGTNDKSSLHFIEILMKFPNIHFRNMNLWQFSFKTPIFEWLKTNALFESKYVYEHMSDIFRAITLYKYGGFYLDLDVVVQKNVDYLGEDFIGDDWGDVVNAAVMHLNNHGIGIKLIQKYFSKVLEKYDGADFLSAGPMMVTHVLNDICSTSERKLWTRKRCSGLSLHPKEVFYPLSWTNFSLYLDPTKLFEVVDLIKNSALIHVWNDRSKKHWDKTGVKNAYQVVAKRNCPNIYKSSTRF